MARRWQKAEITYLKRYGSTKSLGELARRFETTAEEVAAQLEELGVDAAGSASVYDDPLVKVFEQALEALHAHKWKDAIGRLERVIEESDQPEVAARARQYLTVCRTQTEAPPTSEDGEDPFLRAVVLKNQGDLDGALKIVGKGSEKDDRFLYLAASIHALRNDGAAAEKALLRAVEIDPKNRVYAFHDPDFSHLREKEEYAHLFSAP